MKNEKPTRLHILCLLKKNGRMTSKQVGDIIGVTSMGARQHLTAMERDGLVASEFVRQKAGRPALYFKLTEKADHYFPQRYGPLAMDILKGVEELKGRDTVEKVLQRRRENLRQNYFAALNNNDMNKADLKEKVKKLAEMRDDDGYMTEMEEDEDALLLREHNCPIHAVAKEYHEVCQHELDLFEEILGAPVERVEHMVKGERSCVYKIAKNGVEKKTAKSKK
ncbi:MAG: transcriptional regulator [Candidatus Omnitrophica bacterium]|nr:transcriptional regulator [Candidatus Omnitrophota bacterium]